MAVRLNRVFLAGNLTRDPQVRFFANERAVANFGIAANRRYRSGDGEMKEETLFVDVEAWGRTAELVGQYLTKGSGCLIEGRLKLDSWEDKDGNKRNQVKIVADNVQFTDGRGAGAGNGDEGGGYSRQGGSSASAPSVPPPVSQGLDDEPPF